jgi:hypothetical protein
MAGNLFALAVLGLVGLTLVILKPFGRRPTMRSGLRGAVAFVLSFSILTIFASLHLCDRGVPVMAIALCALCLGGAQATIDDKRIRRRITFWLGFLSVVFMFWGISLVHWPGYVANPRLPERYDRTQKWQLEDARDVVGQLAKEHPSMKLHTGWVENVCFDSNGKKVFLKPPNLRSASIGRYWHTGITGVFRLTEVEMGIWCPGGDAEQCAARLELREIGEPRPGR